MWSDDEGRCFSCSNGCCRIGCFCVLFLASGCLSGGAAREDIQATDGGSFLPSVRITWQLDQDESGGAAPISLDLEASYASGEDSQRLAGGESLRLSDVVFTGPAEVDQELELLLLHGQVRGGLMLGEHLSLQGLLGLGVQQLNVEIESGGLSDAERITSVTPRVGARATIHITEWLELYGQASYSAGLADGAYTGVKIEDHEVAVTWLAAENLSLLAGWRLIRYEAESDGQIFSVEDSDLDLSLSGPMIALQFAF